MGILVRVWISPLALGALVLGAMLGLRAAWWQVLLVAAGCGILSLVAVVTLMRWAGRRDARRLPLWIAREVPSPAPATVIPQAAAGAPPAVENHYHGPQFHFYGAAGPEAARVIRAIPGGTGHDQR